MTETAYLIFAAQLLGATIMTADQNNQALELEIADNEAGEISVQLKALSASSQKVSYELETSGASRSVHRGETTLAADQPTTLSRMKFSYRDSWCVKLNAVEESGKSYQVEKGGGCR